MNSNCFRVKTENFSCLSLPLQADSRSPLPPPTQRLQHQPQRLQNHRKSSLSLQPIYKFINLLKWTRGYFSPFIDIYNISVDSFFLLSGILVTNSFFREMKRSGRVNIFRFYLHRYLRITPAVALLILVQKFIRFFNDGPFYNSFTRNFQGKCDKYWWSALLHVQNYVNPLQTVSFVYELLTTLDMQSRLICSA
jgi:hypothetical protein